MRHSITIADGCAYGSQSGTAKIVPTHCRLESRDWRSLDQLKSIKTVDWTVSNNCRCCPYRAPSGNKTGTTNRWFESCDWHSLHQTQPPRTLNWLRLPQRSVTIAELCAYGAQSDNKTEPTNCWFESRDWRSLGQPKGIKAIKFWIVCVHRDIQYQSPMFSQAQIDAREWRPDTVSDVFLKRKSVHEKDTEENDLLPEPKGQRLQSSRLMERRCLTVFLPNRLQVWGGEQQNQTRHVNDICWVNRPCGGIVQQFSPWTECRFEGEIEEPQNHNDIGWVNCLWNGVVQQYLPKTDAGLRGRSSREQSFTCTPLPETSFEGENCTKSSEQKFGT